MLGSIILGIIGIVTNTLSTPISVSVSPDRQFALRVFSAGQSSIPPDYRADVRYVLRRNDGWWWSRDTLVAEAAMADGWAVRWTATRSISLEAGPLSWFSFVRKHAADVDVSVHVKERSPDEASCIEQTLTNAINGVICFDRLVGREQPPPHTRSNPP